MSENAHGSMRLVRHGDGRTGIVVEENGALLVHDLAGLLTAGIEDEGVLRTIATTPGASWSPLITHWSRLSAVLEAALRDAASQGQAGAMLADVALDAPLPGTDCRVFALAGNFYTHVAQAEDAIYGERKHSATEEARRANGPWGFPVLSGTIVGPGATITPPVGYSKIDYEGEVAAVIAEGGRDLTPEQVRFWGYTAWNDLSVRDGFLGIGDPFDRGPMTWTLSKNFDSGNAAGPWLLVDPAADLGAIGITLRVNGETRQHGSTAEMIFSFAETAAHLSRFLTLRPGDVILSGTPAGTALESGVGGPFLQAGDRVEVDVAGITTLSNQVGAVVTKESVA